MKNFKVVLLAAVSVVVIVSFALVAYRLSSDQVVSTLVKYAIDDAFVDHHQKSLMLGSSTIKRIDHEKFLACGIWLNRGIGNSDIADLQAYLSVSSLSIQPPTILLYAGENDISRGMTASFVVKSYQALIERLIEIFPQSTVHVFAIKPSPRRQAYWSEFSVVNRALEQAAEMTSQVFFHAPEHPFTPSSFAADGVHLSPDGYSLFTHRFNKTCKTK